MFRFTGVVRGEHLACVQHCSAAQGPKAARQKTHQRVLSLGMNARLRLDLPPHTLPLRRSFWKSRWLPSSTQLNLADMEKAHARWHARQTLDALAPLPIWLQVPGSQRQHPYVQPLKVFWICRPHLSHATCCGSFHPLHSPSLTTTSLSRVWFQTPHSAMRLVHAQQPQANPGGTLCLLAKRSRFGDQLYGGGSHCSNAFCLLFPSNRSNLFSN